jgi:hypothetical protein
MNDAETMALGERPRPVTLHAEQQEDEPFLRAVSAGTRQEELHPTGWNAATRAAFLDQQFKAMRQGYSGAYSATEF